MSKNSILREPGFPVGLENCGNTCFMNSLIQFYFMIPPLVRLVFQATPQSSDPTSLFLKNLQILFAELLGSAKKAVNPRPLLESLEKAAGKSFKFGSQEDIGEFHMIFIETLKKSIKSSGVAGSVEISLKKMFSGKNNEIVVVQKDGKRQEVNQLTTGFSTILIGNKEENLVTEWQNTIFSDISGLLRESLIQGDAQQEIWIEKLPEVLFFQIKRVYYIEGLDETYKDSTGLKVPKELYADRMLLKNREVTLQLKDECFQLNQKKKELVARLHVFQPESKNTLINSIGTIKNFFHTKEALEFCPDVEPSINYFNTLEAYINKKITEIQAQIKQIESDMEKIDSQIISKYESMQDNRFLLHCILIHDGSSGFGHYFALIKDFIKDSWRMYNDSFIRDIEESEVFNMVQGKREGTSAYCLIYVNPDTIIQSTTGLPLVVFQPSLFDQGRVECDYQCYIQNDAILGEISRKNIQIYEESKIEENKEAMKQIFNNFQAKRSEILNRNSEKFSEIQSFPSFLRHDSKGYLCNYAILDSISVTYFNKRLKDLDKNLKASIFTACKLSSNDDLNIIKFQEYDVGILRFHELLKFFYYSGHIIDLIAESKYNPATRIYSCCIYSVDCRNQTVYDYLQELMKGVLCSLFNDLIIAAKHKNLQGLTEICESIQLLIAIFKEHSFDNVLIQIEKKYLSGFNREKDLAAQCFAKAKDKALNLDPVYEKAVQDLNEFNENFSKIDPVCYEDQGTTYQKIYFSYSKISNKFSRWKSINEKKLNNKKLEMKDFE